MNKLGKTRALVVERELLHSVRSVWSALTQRALLRKWLMENDFEPVLGRRFSFRVAPFPHWDGVTVCQVVTVEANRCLAYTWNASCHQAMRGLEYLVTWTLAATKQGALVRVEQSGLRLEDESVSSGAKSSWMRYVGALERVLNRPHLAADGGSSLELEQPDSANPPGTVHCLYGARHS